jgi:hypothetical protein
VFSRLWSSSCCRNWVKSYGSESKTRSVTRVWRLRSIGFLRCLRSCCTNISFIISNCLFCSCVWWEVAGILVTS